ncbi:hypothetical protein G5714_022474 [Onychostoma macrolepis]|uniref:Uncharacterized protein n=1 Tax=Onychostoma macrolepis TaxID=369639 RepID=A0A7J6BQD7_9TELE|nr:hypothetical protein G5714_022474 [Onychostoma macrolepis]
MVDSQQWVYKHPRNLGVPQASRKTWHDAKRESAFKVLPTLLPQSIFKNGGKVFRPTTRILEVIHLMYNLWGPTR